MCEYERKRMVQAQLAGQRSGLRHVSLVDQLLGDPNRPRDWPKEPTDVEKAFADAMEKTWDRAAKVTGEITRRIDEDIALLLRAGVSFHRISLAERDVRAGIGDPLVIQRELHVDGRAVQTYTLTCTAEEAK